jgi:hypothetical protein
MTAPRWKYEVDERRKRKHHWDEPVAGFVEEGGETVGKCPNTMALARAEQLLNSQGIPWYRPRSPRLPWPDRIYVVYAGVVYRAVPTVAGTSYHAFPELPERLRAQPKKLRELLLAEGERLGCRDEVEDWIEQ